jgi:hypothetical protein
MPKTLSLPEATEPILPLATELMTAIGKAKLDHYKRTSLEEPSFPEVTVSKTLAERAARAFHVLLNELEPLGITFQKFRGIHDTGYFERHRDRLYISIVEDLVRPDGTRGVSPWGWPREKASPSGYLSFSFKPERYSNREIQEWSESTKVSLGKTLAGVVAGIRNHYLEIQKRREIERAEASRRHAEWLIQKEEWDRQEAIRLEQEKERKLAETIAAAVAARKKALLQAADNWRQSNILLEFIAVCETRWKNETDVLAPEQIAWLTWARGIAAAVSPFSMGYPAPAKDGAFDSSSIRGGETSHQSPGSE